jgi:hypothetical protein
MRIFLSFLFCSAALQGMEGLEGLPAAAPEPAVVDHGYKRPILKQAILKQAASSRQQPPAGAPVSPTANSIAQKYKDDAVVLLTNLDELDREFTDAETMNDLAYYEQQYSVNYKSFMARVKSLNGQPNSDQLKLQKAQLALDFALLARQAHNDNADFHKEATQTLTVQQIALQGAHQDQITKTKYANWRAYGVAAAGFALTLITGLITYFEHPANGSTGAPNNTAG